MESPQLIRVRYVASLLWRAYWPQAFLTLDTPCYRLFMKGADE
ncbi:MULTISPECIES: hypothetical protein [unclassified Pseudomonas]|nr:MULTISPECIES: hypothetical protein [unclassified Pseudomonas]